MNEIEKKLNFLKSVLEKCSLYKHATSIINYDQETICPPMAIEEQGEVNSFLNNESFKLKSSDEFKSTIVFLYDHINEIENDLDKVLITRLHRSYLQDKNITPELQLDISKIFNRSFVNWLNAKNKSDYSIFEPSLKEVIQAEKKMVDLDEARKSTYYDTLISYYEEDLSVKELDEFFSSLKKGIVPLLEKIKKSSHKVRTDFLTRKVAISKQEQFTKYLLDTIGFD